MILAASLLLALASLGATKPAGERQLTTGPLQKDLDNNINWSPDGRLLVFDCRTHQSGIGENTRLGTLDVRTGKVAIIYEQHPPVAGVGAPSFLDDHHIIAISALDSGLKYDFTVRGGRIIPANGSGKTHWMDSRDLTPPFTPGALRGGTHKHEPDATGRWVGFTYNDEIVRLTGRSDLRNLGVCHLGHAVKVHPDTEGRNFEGTGFSVLLTACVPDPRPGSDEIGRAEGDCWIGKEGYPKPDGSHQRARAFRGQVAVLEGGETKRYGDVFVVDVPDDITVPGPLGPLQGTDTDYPKPPAGATIRRLTRTADAPDPRLRGVEMQMRASGDGRWIVFTAGAERDGKIEKQVFVVSPVTGEIRQLSHLEGGVPGDCRFSPDSRYVAASTADGRVIVLGATDSDWGKLTSLTPPNPNGPMNIVVSPDSRTIAYNRSIDGVHQIFVVPAPGR